MSSLFEKYDDVDETTVTAKEQYCKVSKKRLLRKKDRKKIKKLTKALCKHNELMEQEAERRKAEEEAAAEAARLKAQEEAKEVEKRKSAKGAVGFLTKLGDAVCKAVPKVLTTLVTLAFGWFVKAKFDKQMPQAT